MHKAVQWNRSRSAFKALFGFLMYYANWNCRLKNLLKVSQREIVFYYFILLTYVMLLHLSTPESIHKSASKSLVVLKVCRRCPLDTERLQAFNKHSSKINRNICCTLSIDSNAFRKYCSSLFMWQVRHDICKEYTSGVFVVMPRRPRLFAPWWHYIQLPVENRYLFISLESSLLSCKVCF